MLKERFCRSAHHVSMVAKEVEEHTPVDLLTSPLKSFGGSKYALMFKDDLSRYRTVYFLKSKNNTTNLFVDYLNTPRRIRSDNGTEKINKSVDELCSGCGIIHEITCPFMSEQN